MLSELTDCQVVEIPACKVNERTGQAVSADDYIREQVEAYKRIGRHAEACNFRPHVQAMIDLIREDRRNELVEVIDYEQALVRITRRSAFGFPGVSDNYLRLMYVGTMERESRVREA